MSGNNGMLSPASILIVEHEVPVRETMQLWLEQVGYHCACADRGLLARRMLDNHAYDMVITNVELSDESGLELLNKIRVNHSEMVVLMLTGGAQIKLAVQALTCGAYGYLIKPMEREELLCLIEKSLDHRRLVFENRDQMAQMEQRVRDQTRHIRQAHEETIQRLVMACMFRDDETAGHIKRTGLSSALVAQAAGWSTEMVELIQLAAPMHDVGKVGIPDSILRNTGLLTAEEHAVMQTHTLLGAKMLAGSLSPVLQMAEQIAHYHHERWDGTGYPERLAGGNIPRAARIMAIVDVYDALTHDRPYRRAFPEVDVLRRIEASSGSHFDPTIVNAFFDALPGIRKINSCELDQDFSGSSDVPLDLLEVPMTVAPAFAM